MVPYSDFVCQIHSISFEAHDPRLLPFLGEISSEESAAGRGMLKALVCTRAVTTSLARSGWHVIY